MTRKRVINKSTTFNEINKKIDKERERMQSDIDSFNLVEHAGGSINNLPVKTKAFGSWLDAHRVNNPFIGKHVTSAPEEYTEEIKLNDDEVLDEEATETFLTQANVGLTAFDPNSTFGDEVEYLGDALKGDSTHDAKFIDLSIIENMTKKYLALAESEIEFEAIRAMKAYHGDNSYKSDLNISNIIEESKILFIEQKKQDIVNAEPLKLSSTNKNVTI